jgi:hypothetical protein
LSIWGLRDGPQRGFLSLSGFVTLFDKATPFKHMGQVRLSRHFLSLSGFVTLFDKATPFKHMGQVRLSRHFLSLSGFVALVR